MLIENFRERTQNIVQRIEAMAKVSEDKNCLTRSYGSGTFQKVTQLMLNWMHEAGLTTRIDNIGNVIGRLEATIPTDKTFIIGSHLDTVKNAGKFDGQLGLLIALDIAEQLNQFETDLPFNIEVVGFCDEEGVRFTTTYLGSSVLSNTFQKEWLNRRDDEGLSLAEVIKKNGGDPDYIPRDAINADECLGFFEVHIEQGPVLEKNRVPVGIVTCIAGQTRVEVKFMGKAGHAGTTPMNMRQDALCAAVDFISEVEKYALNSNKSVIATVGKLITKPNVSNVIPSEVICSLDLRSPDDNAMFEALAALENKANQICKMRKLWLDWTVLQQNEAVGCDPLLCDLLEQAISQSGIEKIIKLSSGAGHDAVALSAIMPVSMLFVQCKEGISHHPDEFVKVEDISAALQVSELYLKELIRFHQLPISIEVEEEVY